MQRVPRVFSCGVALEPQNSESAAYEESNILDQEGFGRVAGSMAGTQCAH